MIIYDAILCLILLLNIGRQIVIPFFYNLGLSYLKINLDLFLLSYYIGHFIDSTMNQELLGFVSLWILCTVTVMTTGNLLLYLYTDMILRKSVTASVTMPS